MMITSSSSSTIKLSRMRGRPARLQLSAQDKREREMLVTRLQKTVQKSKDLKIPCFAGTVLVDSKRNILKTEFLAPPGTALERVLADPAIREPLVRAMEDTIVEMLEPDNHANIKEEVSLRPPTPKHSDMGSPAQTIRKPVKPIFSMSNIDMITYFPQFLKDLYTLEGWATGTYRLHPKLNAAGEVLVAPDKLKIYDEIAEGILPRSKYCGSGKKFGKNLLLKQKNVCSYILSKLGIDHATFFLEENKLEVISNNEVSPEAFDIHLNDTVESEESHEPDYIMDTEHNPEMQEDNISDDDKNISGESSENALKVTRKKRKKYESSDPSESSSSDSDSARELNISKRYSRKKRSSKHSRKESEIFHKTFMKMMQNTMKSVIMKQLS